MTYLNINVDGNTIWHVTTLWQGYRLFLQESVLPPFLLFCPPLDGSQEDTRELTWKNERSFDHTNS
jgi:hypothetical protein